MLSDGKPYSSILKKVKKAKVKPGTKKDKQTNEEDADYKLTMYHCWYLENIPLSLIALIGF